jgi:hypothetical protein
MLPAERVQKLSTSMNVELMDGQEVFGRYADGGRLAAALWLLTVGYRKHRYLGKVRQPPILKAWHTHGNTLPGGVDFYSLLPKVGKDP